MADRAKSEYAAQVSSGGTNSKQLSSQKWMPSCQQSITHILTWLISNTNRHAVKELQSVGLNSPCSGI